MLGTLLNAVGILLGGAIGLIGRQALSPATESMVKVVLSVFTVFSGLRLVWQNLGGSPGNVLKQILLLMVALVAGNAIGRLSRLQGFSNRMGQRARERMAAPPLDPAGRLDAGFKTCAALFCAAPLGLIGAVVDGLSLAVKDLAAPPENIWPLAIKTVMDGLAAMGFARLFGPGVLLSAVPVLALQGTLSLCCARWLGPVLAAHGLLGSVQAAAGLLLLCVAVVMLGLKRIPLADYLPTLILAPLLARWWGW